MCTGAGRRLYCHMGSQIFAQLFHSFGHLSHAEVILYISLECTKYLCRLRCIYRPPSAKAQKNIRVLVSEFPGYPIKILSRCIRSCSVHFAENCHSRCCERLSDGLQKGFAPGKCIPNPHNPLAVLLYNPSNFCEHISAVQILTPFKTLKLLSRFATVIHVFSPHFSFSNRILSATS